MKKKIFALLMAMVLVLGMSTTALAETDSPVVDNTPEINSPTGDNEPVEMGEVKVTWSKTDKWTVEVDNVTPEGESWCYDAWVYKDGKFVENSYIGKEATYGEKVLLDVANVIAVHGDGKYTVEVSVNHYNQSNNQWIITHEGLSDARAYVASAKLAIPTNLAFNLETATLTFDQVKDAEGYVLYVTIYVAGNKSGGWEEAYIDASEVANNKVEYVLEGLAEEIKELKESFETDEEMKAMDFKYVIGVMALTGDIDKVASSDYAELLLLENKVSKEQAKENFDKAFEGDDIDIDVAVGALGGVSNDTIVEMLEADVAFAEKVEKLDAACIEELGDSYKGATSKTEKVDATKVKVVGLAINGDPSAESNELIITDVEADAKVEIPEGYKDGIQLDISFMIDEYSVENLAVPVTITMPIPTGVAKENLVILHYHGDATTPDVIVPTVNEDGTMTFIVSGFSTFVVTNEVVEEAPTPTPTPEKPAPEAPKTGDTSGTALVCSLLFLAAGVVLVMKRNSFAK